MGVNAKLHVDSKEKFVGQGGGWSGTRVKMSAALGKANESWATASPSAQFELVIANEEAAKQFVPGTYVTVTFEPAGDPPAE